MIIYPQTTDPLLKILSGAMESLELESGISCDKKENILKFLKWLNVNYKITIFWKVKYANIEKIEIDDDCYVMLLLRFSK